MINLLNIKFYKKNQINSMLNKILNKILNK